MNGTQERGDFDALCIPELMEISTETIEYPGFGTDEKGNEVIGIASLTQHQSLLVNRHGIYLNIKCDKNAEKVPMTSSQQRGMKIFTMEGNYIMWIEHLKVGPILVWDKQSHV